MTSAPAARAPGAMRAGPGAYLFDLGAVQTIMGGPAYSTAFRACVEGDRMIVRLMRKPSGTCAEPHYHPNEQRIHLVEGTFRNTIGGKTIEARPGAVIYIPADTIHSGGATADCDFVFFAVKDDSHSLHGIKVG
jgi:quercetin dioxygenase-like cupin family protein